MNRERTLREKIDNPLHNTGRAWEKFVWFMFALASLWTPWVIFAQTDKELNGRSGDYNLPDIESGSDLWTASIQGDIVHKMFRDKMLGDAWNIVDISISDQAEYDMIRYEPKASASLPRPS